MPRALWTGNVSFGLLNVPVQLITADRPSEISLRMIDKRDENPIKFKRVNSVTGAEVPWEKIAKAYEYEKGEFVTLTEDDFKQAAPKAGQSIDIEKFVDRSAISPAYFERPYYLVPGKKAEKAYVLLRDTLEKTGKLGLARVVLRTKEYLCAVAPEEDALMLVILRFPEEIVPADELEFPGKASEYRITDRELQMAGQLIESMEDKFDPKDFKNDYADRLDKMIQKKLGAKGAGKAKAKPKAAEGEPTTNVVDFMSLLKQSIEKGKRTGAAPAAAKTPAKKKAAAKSTARAAAPKKRKVAGAR